MQDFNNLKIMKESPRGLPASAQTDGSVSISLLQVVELVDLGEKNTNSNKWAVLPYFPNSAAVSKEHLLAWIENGTIQEPY